MTFINITLHLCAQVANFEMVHDKEESTKADTGEQAQQEGVSQPGVVNLAINEEQLLQQVCPAQVRVLLCVYTKTDSLCVYACVCLCLHCCWLNEEHLLQQVCPAQVRVCVFVCVVRVCVCALLIKE